jgi:transposase
MEHYIGIDVSLELSSLCVLDATGKVIREAKVASEPEALVAFLRGLGVSITRVGLEAGPLSQWRYDGLSKGGFDVVLLETRHAKAALSAMAIKTDRRDARGIAQLGAEPGGPVATEPKVRLTSRHHGSRRCTGAYGS